MMHLKTTRWEGQREGLHPQYFIFGVLTSPHLARKAAAASRRGLILTIGLFSILQDESAIPSKDVLDKTLPIRKPSWGSASDAR
jgi:hypothetical protein